MAKNAKTPSESIEPAAGGRNEAIDKKATNMNNCTCCTPSPTGREYTITDPKSPYYGWKVREGADMGREVFYTENREETCLIRVHYRYAKVPAHKVFTIRHLKGATDEDREIAMKSFEELPEVFRDLERGGKPHRAMNKQGRYWVFSFAMGRRVEDPLIQLELEMMIDLSEGRISDVTLEHGVAL